MNTLTTGKRCPGKTMYSVTIAVLYAVALSLSVTAYDIPPEMKEIVEAAHKSCKEETGISQEMFANAIRGILADDRKVKCFVKCVFQQLQAMGEDGTLDLTLIEASMPPELKDLGAMDAVKKCMDQPEKDLCSLAYDILTCIQKENPKLSEFFN